MGKKEQIPARAIFVQGSLWVWSATSRGRPPDGGLALAVFHIVPPGPPAGAAAPNIFVHPPAKRILKSSLSEKKNWPARTGTTEKKKPLAAGFESRALI